MRNRQPRDGHSRAARYGVAVAGAALALAARAALGPYLHDHLKYAPFFVAVTAVAWYGGPWPALLSTTLGFIAAVWSSIPPGGSIWLEAASDPAGAAGYFIVALTVAFFSHVMHKARDRALARQRELEGEARDRLRAERDLRASEERYQSLFESMTEGFALHEIICGENGEPCDYRFLEVNPAFEKLTGLKREEVVGRTLREILPNEDPKWVQIYGRVALSGEPARFEDYAPSLKQHYEVLAYRTAPNRFAALFTIVSARKQAEEALRQSELLYRSIGELIDYGIWVCAPDGRNTYASESFLKLVGLTQQQCSDFGWGDALHPDDAERTISAWKECVRTGGTWDIEHRFRGVDGKWHNVLARGVPIRDEQGGIRCWAGINLDITKLKQAEEEIRSLAEFPSRNPSPVLRLGRDGRILYANDASRGLLEEWGARVGGEAPRNIRDLAEEVLRRGSDTTVDVAQGERTWSFSVAPVAGSGYAHLYGRDVTERKRAEEAIKQAREALEVRVRERTNELNVAMETLARERQRFQDVLDVLPAYVILLTPDYHVPFENRFFKERFGASKGRPCYEYLFGRNEPCEICETYTVLETMKPHRWEWTGPDGRNYDISDFPFTDVDGSPLILEMGIDITDRKRAEAELERYRRDLERLVEERTSQLQSANLRLEAVLESLPVGIALLDGQGGVVSSNAAFERIWGSPRPVARAVSDYAAYKARWTDTGRPVQPDEWASARAVREGKTVIGQSIQLETFDGARRFVLNSAVPIRDAGGGIAGCAVALQDVTELTEAQARTSQLYQEARQEIARRQQVERELRRSNEDLEQFAFAISHDLRSPLNAITSFAQQLKADYGGRLGEEADIYLAYLTGAAERVRVLLSDLLAYSRTGREAGGKTGPSSGEEALRSAELNLETRIREGQATITHTALPHVMLSKGLLAQIFQNLLENAIKFRGPAPPRIHVSAEPLGEKWVFCVADNGLGIDPAQAQQVFRIFRRLHGDRYEGTGIGLAICRKIVERHGGHIWVESKPGEGARFFFSLPSPDMREEAARKAGG